MFILGCTFLESSGQGLSIQDPTFFNVKLDSNVDRERLVRIENKDKGDFSVSICPFSKKTSTYVPGRPEGSISIVKLSVHFDL